MRRTVTTVMLLLALAGNSIAYAEEPARNSQGGGGGGTALWTALGAGGGFGIGLWAGLTAFDDAIDSDRKVWTSAIVGAAVGGVIGYLIGHTRAKPAPAARNTRAERGTTLDAPLPALEKPAPALGSGDFRMWLETQPSLGAVIRSSESR